MKRFKCHKVVSAGQIVAAEIRENGAGRIVFDNGSGNVAVFEADPGFARSNVEAGKFPVAGDYLVIYEDGYASWSPKAVFEAGYSEIGEEVAGTPQKLPGAISVSISVPEDKVAKMFIGNEDYSTTRTLKAGDHVFGIGDDVSLNVWEKE